MALSRRQKICSAILAVVFGVLLMDRVFVSRKTGPDEASAKSVALKEEPNVPLTKLADAGSRSASVEVARRLNTLYPNETLDLGQTRDAFSLPPVWLAEVNAQSPLGEAGPVARFVKNHQLTAVLIDGKTKSALVDGHCLSLGQELDGFELVAVDENSATFEAGSKRAVLKLKNDR